MSLNPSHSAYELAIRIPTPRECIQLSLGVRIPMIARSHSDMMARSVPI
jgi:hypothetical protein